MKKNLIYILGILTCFLFSCISEDPDEPVVTNPDGTNLEFGKVNVEIFEITDNSVGINIRLESNSSCEYVDLYVNDEYNTITATDADDTVNYSSYGYFNNNNGLTVNDNTKVIVEGIEYEHISLNSNETRDITIGDKTYTVINNKTSDNTLEYGIDSQTGQITFRGSSFGVEIAHNEYGAAEFLT